MTQKQLDLLLWLAKNLLDKPYDKTSPRRAELEALTQAVEMEEDLRKYYSNKLADMNIAKGPWEI